MGRRIHIGEIPYKTHQSEHSVADLRETLTPGPATSTQVVLLRQSNCLGIVCFETTIRGTGSSDFTARREHDRVVYLHFADRPNAEMHFQLTS